MERDDLEVNDSYYFNAHHSEEDGKKIRKKIWMVTGILTLITASEVIVGLFINRMSDPGSSTWELIKYGYLILTLIKAGYIVLVFMHLGDETKNFRRVVLWPYFAFICYLIFIALTESGYIQSVLEPLKFW